MRHTDNHSSHNNSIPPQAGPSLATGPAVKRLNHSVWWPILAGASAGLLLRFVFNKPSGHPFSAMLGSFIYGAPLLSAVISSWLIGPQRRAQLLTCMLVGGVSASWVVLGSLMVLIDGWICALVIFPFFFIVGTLAGLVMWAVYRVLDQLVARRAVYSFAALPLILGAVEPQLAPPPHEYHQTVQTIFIRARPEVVWQNLLQTPPMNARLFASSYAAWLGVPPPLAANTVQNARGQWVRHMQWGKGVHFYGDVTAWRPGEELAWNYRFDSDSFPAGALDDHVTLTGEHFALMNGRYTLAAADGGTVLTETTHWRISTQFNGYARFLGKLLIADTVSHLVSVIKTRSEYDEHGKGSAPRAAL